MSFIVNSNFCYLIENTRSFSFLIENYCINIIQNQHSNNTTKKENVRTVLVKCFRIIRIRTIYQDKFVNHVKKTLYVDISL